MTMNNNKRTKDEGEINNIVTYLDYTVPRMKRTKYYGARPIPILAYLLSVALALVYTICRSQFLPSAAVICALTAGVFMLFYKLRDRSVISGVTTVGLLLTGWFVGMAAASYQPDGMTFMDFLFMASAKFDLLFAVAAIYIFSLIIGFIGCYFSVLNPRPCFLMLLMFIPLILSSRTARQLPVYFIVAMAGCFIFAAANLSEKYPNAGEAIFEDKPSRRRGTIVSGIAAAAIALIASLLPHSDAPFGDYLDSITPSSTGYYANSNIVGFSSYSSVNSGMNKPSGDLLFTVRANSPEYLVRCGYDVYTDGGWYALQEYDTGYAGWEYGKASSNYIKFLRTLSLYSDQLSEESRQLIDGLPVFNVHSSIMEITEQGEVFTRAVVHPSFVTGAYFPEECGRTYLNPRNDLFTEYRMPADCTFQLEYFPYSENEHFIRRLDADSLTALVNDANDCGVITASAAYSLLDELSQAQEYQAATRSTGITPEIKQLADEITAGVTTDYDKARAIERWFGEAGFVYDLDFVPEKPDTNYFLFESRTGICSDFASAMTLLARAAGLPARYIEGFVMDEEKRDELTGVYYITDAESHAYTQIYFPGGGWLDFDATKYSTKAEENNGSVPLWVYAAAAVGATAVLAFIFRKQLSELIFLLVCPISNAPAKIRSVYLRTRRLAADLSGQEESSLTTGEVRLILTQRLGMPQEADDICSAADKLLYSPEHAADSADKLLQEYKALKKRRRRLK